MPTPITIHLDPDNIRHMSIVGPVSVTLPKTGYLARKAFTLPGVTLERLRVWTELRQARVNPNQFSMDGLGGKDNAKT